MASAGDHPWGGADMFTSTKSIRHFHGGPEEFIRQAWNTAISSADDLLGVIQFETERSARLVLQQYDPGARFQGFLERFLRKISRPACTKTLTEMAEAGYYEVLDYARFDQPGYRSQLFSEAALGCSRLLPGRKINVSPGQVGR